jgi:hypothetical protein
MAKNEHRARFVITDNGRIITYAVYNTDKKQFDNIKSFIYPNKIKGEVYLSLNLKQNDYIKDITTNF